MRTAKLSQSLLGELVSCVLLLVPLASAAQDQQPVAPAAPVVADDEAQRRVVVRIRRVFSVADERKLTSADVDSLEKFDKLNVGTKMESVPTQAETVGRCSDRIVFRFFRENGGAPVALGDTPLTTIATFFNGVIGEAIDLTGYNDRLPFFVYQFDRSKPLGRRYCDAKHNDLVTLRPRLGSTFVEGNIKRRNEWEPYGKNIADIIGIWWPIGLFATNFKTSDQGLEFAALPVSAALGARRWFGSEFYLGPSFLVSYAVGNKATDAGNVFLTGAAAGFMLDFGSYLYVSGTYQWDFTKGGPPRERDPGWMLGVGAGPGLLSALGATQH